MKISLLSFVLALTAVPAFAATDPIIAQQVVSIGYRPPQVPGEVIVSVSVSGKVVETSKYDDGKVEKVDIATLSAPVLNHLKAKIAAVQPGDLIDPNPKDPPCMDAPSVIYEVAAADGTMTKVGAAYGCKELAKKDYPQADAEIVSQLKALSNLRHN